MLSSIFFLENASQISLRSPEEIEPLSYQGQRSKNPARWERAAIKPGPGRSLCSSSGFLPKKAGLPGPGGQRGVAPQGSFRHPQRYAAPGCPGRWSGFGPAQVQTSNVGSRPVPGRIPGFALESPDARVAGEGPPPGLGAARWHSLVLAIVVPDPFEGLFPPKSKTDLGRISGKIC